MPEDPNLGRQNTRSPSFTTPPAPLLPQGSTGPPQPPGPDLPLRPGQKPGPTRITVPQNAFTAEPTLTRNRATVSPTRRPARRAHRLPRRLAPHGSPTPPRHTRSGRPGLDPAQRRPLSPTRTTELQDALHSGVSADSDSCHGQSHATTGSTGPPASHAGWPHGGPTHPRRTRSGRPGLVPRPAVIAQSRPTRR